MNRLMLFLTLAILAHIPHQTYAAGQGVGVRNKKFESYLTLGCWKDTIPRVIPTLEGYSTFLDGPYKHRMNAVNKCLKAALEKKFEVFAVQDGGQCFSSADARSKYKQSGNSDKCKIMKGGPMANDVYEVGPLKRCLVLMPQRHYPKLTFRTEQSKRNVTDETALHVAAKFGETECAKILINSNAPIEAVDNQNKTPLAVAAGYNKCEIMKALVEMKAKEDTLSRQQKDNLKACIPVKPETSPLTVGHDSSKCLEDNGNGLLQDLDCKDCSNPPKQACANGYVLKVTANKNGCTTISCTPA